MCVLRVLSRPPVQLLHNPDLHPHSLDRHSVVGLLLDRRDSSPGACHLGDPDRAHDDVTEQRRQPASTTSILHKGATHVPVGVNAPMHARITYS